jgi:hypothetical protein
LKAREQERPRADRTWKNLPIKEFKNYREVAESPGD